jgi:large subunit ribosomal protein L23
MGFLDRFKKKKELELEKAAPEVSVAKEKPKAEGTKGAKVVEEAAKAEKAEEKKPAAKIETKTKATKAAARTVSGELADVLIRPVVTEKSAVLASFGQYVFMVNPDANRVRVGQAVKAVYGIQPSDVRIQNVRSEPVRFGRVYGKQKVWKKAIVTLPKGKTIDVYQGV